jgi:urease accessory protein
MTEQTSDVFGQHRDWRLRPVNPAAALRLDWNAGNLHWRVRFTGDCLLVASYRRLRQCRARTARLLSERGIVEKAQDG